MAEAKAILQRSERGWITFGEYNKDCLEDLFYEGHHIECMNCGAVRVISTEPLVTYWLWCEGCKAVVKGNKFKKV